MDILIRKIKPEETKQADELLTKLIQDERQYDSNIDENFKVDSFYENYINNDNICLLVGVADNKIVGYIYGFIKDEVNVTKERTVQLDALFVEEEYRSLGIASSLIEYFKDWVKSKNIKLIEVSVCSGNIIAKRLYNKHDFRNQIKETLLLNLE